MISRYVLRRESIMKDIYWYVIVRLDKEFPLGIEMETKIGILFNEASGSAIVDALNNERIKGIIEGITKYAWWKDSVQYVGTCGTTLEQAIKELDRS